MLDNTPSRTAEIVALIRALENVYYGEKSLLKDKYAVRFLSDFYTTIYNRLSVLPDFVSFFVNATSLGLFDFISLRHGFMDKYVRDLGPQMPVLLLGAGYDSRALRLNDYIKHGIWEFDFPATQRRKKFYLRNEQTKGAEVHYCEVDFMKESLAEIFVHAKLEKRPTLVLWEGVSMYVTKEVVRSTIEAVRDYFGKGSYLIYDYWQTLVDHPIKGVLNAILPHAMDIIYNEKFTYGETVDGMRKLALDCGAKKFESYNGNQMMKKLSLTSRLPLTSAAVAVLEF